MIGCHISLSVWTGIPVLSIQVTRGRPLPLDTLLFTIYTINKGYGSLILIIVISVPKLWHNHLIPVKHMKPTILSKTESAKLNTDVELYREEWYCVIINGYFKSYLVMYETDILKPHPITGPDWGPTTHIHIPSLFLHTNSPSTENPQITGTLKPSTLK